MLTPDQQIDKLCDEFESSMRAQEQLDIDDFLPRIGPEHREALFEQLLLVQHDLSNETVDVSKYERCHPEYSNVVKRLFGGKTNGDQSDKHKSRFEVVRTHARGGLGEVFVANDQELNREVALKEIQARYADHAESRSRFVLEAEVTGGLEHPGIVPVYGLGQYSDGRPFYAMRFIRGDSLKEAIKAFHDNTDQTDSQRTLQLRSLLARFIDVCQAIGYAHSRGVLHRDIKPSNIMLGDYGETLVVDWGLAKVADRHETTGIPGETTLRPQSGSVTPTLAGRAMGTPAYMPPEQAAGRLEELGPASDVYSLGATLYQLLTGGSPFDGTDVQTTLADVQAGNFTPPRKRKSEIPKAMEAVCLKAMSLKPSDRYQSPQALASDVERFLADEAVTALREPLIQRSRRWVRKHPTFTAVTAAAVLISTISALAFSSLVAGKNRELKTKNAELVVAKVSETRLRELAQANEQVAKEQSKLALETLTSVIRDLQAGLKNVAGGTEVRGRILKTSLEKLQLLSTKYVEQATADHQTIQALMEMGDVVAELGGSEEDEFVFDLDDSEQANAWKVMGAKKNSAEQRSASQLAMRYYIRAKGMAQTLFDADPTNNQARSDLCLAHTTIGYVQLKGGESNAALDSFQRSFKLCHMLVNADSGVSQPHDDLANSYKGIGAAKLQMGDAPAALEAYQHALEIRQTQLNEDIVSQRALSYMHINVGNVQLHMGNSKAALESAQNALDIRRALVIAHPEDSSLQQELAVAYNAVGAIQERLGNPQAWRNAYQNLFQIRQTLATADPSNLAAQRDLAYSHDKIGKAQYAAGEISLAMDSYKSALEIRQSLALADSRNASAQEDVAHSYFAIGTLHLKSKQLKLSLESYQNALKIAQTLVSNDPDNVGLQSFLSAIHGQIANVQQALGDYSNALSSSQRSREILESLSDHPFQLVVQLNLKAAWYSVGRAQLKLGRISSAFDSFHRSLKIVQSLASKDPNDVSLQSSLSHSNSNLAKAYFSIEKIDEGIQHLERSKAILSGMIRKGNNIKESKKELLYVQSQLAIARNQLIAMGDWEDLLKQPPKKLPRLLETRAIAFAKQRNFAAATQAVAKLREQEHARYGNLYNASCIYCMAAASVAPAKGKPLSEDQREQRKEWIDAAVASLKESVEAGWKDIAHIERDSDLAILKDEPEFKALMKRLRKQ